MSDRFRHYLKLSAGWHAAIIFLILVVPLVLNWRFRHRKKEMIQFIDLSVAMPEIPAAALEAVKQPELKPEPEPPKDIPDPESSKPKIQRSTKKITRPKPKTPQLTPEEIRKLLAAGAKISDKASYPTGEFPTAWYYALVRQTMYDAWNQPSGSAVPPGLVTEVTLRVQRDGTITSRQITGPSGNAVMDESVRRAVHAVSRLRALPPEFSGPYRDIVIEFELAKGMM